MDAHEIRSLGADDAAAAVADLDSAALDELEQAGETRRTVARAIAARRRQLAEVPRTFQIAGADIDRVTVGGNPRVTITAGGPYTTTDPRLAARLARQPELEETTP